MAGKIGVWVIEDMHAILLEDVSSHKHSRYTHANILLLGTDSFPGIRIICGRIVF